MSGDRNTALLGKHLFSLSMLGIIMDYGQGSFDWCSRNVMI